LGQWQSSRGEDPTESYRAAIEDYTRALELNANYAEAHNNRGIAYWALGQWQSSRGEDPTESYRAAIEDYTRALELNPNYARAHYNRGYVRYLMKQYSGALEDWRRAVELNPGFEPVLRPWIQRAEEALRAQAEEY
jgi:tetratricopeptide (TPR) repeat protein